MTVSLEELVVFSRRISCGSINGLIPALKISIERRKRRISKLKDEIQEEEREIEVIRGLIEFFPLCPECRGGGGEKETLNRELHLEPNDREWIKCEKCDGTGFFKENESGL